MVYKLKKVVIEITAKCNLRCKHCYSREITKMTPFWTKAKLNSVIDELGDMNVELMIISGGEPLIEFSLLEEALMAAGANDINVILTTNGLLLTPPILERLKSCGLRNIQISLDGSHKNIHEEGRGADTFYKTIEAIKMCLAEGLNVSVMTVPSKRYIEDLYNICNMLEEIGVESWGIERPVPMTGGQFSDYFLSSDDLKRFHTVLENMEKKSTMHIHCNDPIYPIMKFIKNGLKAETFNQFFKDAKLGCTAGTSACVIGVDGKVRPCTFINLFAGDISVNSIKEIWEMSDLFLKFRDTRPIYGNCAGCDYYELCKGCRAQTLSLNEEITSSDPSCYLNYIK